MSKKIIKNSLKKHRFFHDKRRSAEEHAAFGELFFEQGRIYDAAAFFRRASSLEGMERVRNSAIEKGDSFLFLFAARSFPELATPQQWELLGHRAMKLEKFTHATRAFKEANNEEARKQAEESLRTLVSGSTLAFSNIKGEPI